MFNKHFVIGIDLVNQSFLLVAIKKGKRERKKERERKRIIWVSALLHNH